MPRRGDAGRPICERFDTTIRTFTCLVFSDLVDVLRALCLCVMATNVKMLLTANVNYILLNKSRISIVLVSIKERLLRLS